MAERSIEQTRTFIEKAARHNGWVPNPDAEFRETIAEGLTTNANRFGYYLCPCRDGDGDRHEDRDIVCPCVYAKKDVEEYGQCFCGLFLSEEKAAENPPEVRQIPERRHQVD
jgi:ferredoxin-thioredoxin reductase catalytic chain